MSAGISIVCARACFCLDISLEVGLEGRGGGDDVVVADEGEEVLVLGLEGLGEAGLGEVKLGLGVLLRAELLLDLHGTNK